MTVLTELELQAFVLLRLGERRFAVRANQIAELVAPSRVFKFPHRTAQIEGVILRRGRIVPVCDVAEALTGRSVTSRRLYLLAVRHYGPQTEWVALPVTGECELASAVTVPLTGGEPPYVSGIVAIGDETIAIVALEKLICVEPTA